MPVEFERRFSAIVDGEFNEVLSRLDRRLVAWEDGPAARAQVAGTAAECSTRAHHLRRLEVSSENVWRYTYRGTCPTTPWMNTEISCLIRRTDERALVLDLGVRLVPHALIARPARRVFEHFRLLQSLCEIPGLSLSDGTIPIIRPGGFWAPWTYDAKRFVDEVLRAPDRTLPIAGVVWSQQCSPDVPAEHWQLLRGIAHVWAIPSSEGAGIAALLGQSDAPDAGQVVAWTRGAESPDEVGRWSYRRRGAPGPAPRITVVDRMLRDLLDGADAWGADRIGGDAFHHLHLLAAHHGEDSAFAFFRGKHASQVWARDTWAETNPKPLFFLEQGMGDDQLAWADAWGERFNCPVEACQYPVFQSVAGGTPRHHFIHRVAPSRDHWAFPAWLKLGREVIGRWALAQDPLAAITYDVRLVPNHTVDVLIETLGRRHAVQLISEDISAVELRRREREFDEIGAIADWFFCPGRMWPRSRGGKPASLPLMEAQRQLALRHRAVRWLDPWTNAVATGRLDEQRRADRGGSTPHRVRREFLDVRPLARMTLTESGIAAA